MIIFKKRRRGRKGKPIKKKRNVSFFTVLSGLFVLVGCLVFLFYLIRYSGPTHGIPTFETYPSGGTEAIIKRLDRRIYDILLALGVRAEQVTFKTVETKQRGDEEWTFSDLDVRLKKTQTRNHIKKVFVEGLSSVTPKPSVRLSAGVKNGTVVEISVEGNPTHRLHISSLPKRKTTRSLPSRRPLVAIIIDDMGFDFSMASKFLKLNSPLSFSIIPHSPFQKEIASSAHERGRDVLLHLPMEPSEYPEIDPGEGALLSSMTPDELLGQLKTNLSVVPFVVGVNNHMGSKLTQDAAKMRQVFTVLKRRNLFFVDSFTSHNSRCAQAAKLLGLKFARRRVFLDHVQDPHDIRFQIKRLISMANKRGKAIGIGHPYPVTWQVLKEDLKKIDSRVKIVPVSQLVE